MPSAIINHDAVTTSRRNYRIPGDQVRQAIADLPEADRNLLWWFNGWLHRQDASNSDLGRLLRKPGNTGHYSADSIKQLLTGGRIRRGENIAPMLEAINALRRIESERDAQVTSGFIVTRLFTIIEARCLKALARQRIAYIFGESQIGKTESLLEVARRHNHGQTIYVEVPTSGAYTAFLRTLAQALQIPRTTATTDLPERIFAALDSRMLIIIDEAHRFLEAKGIGGLRSLSFVRELWNKVKCGIVMSFTNEGRDLFLKGPHAKALAQLWKRRITPLQLPDTPPDDDAALFAQAYGLEPAGEKPIRIKVETIGEDGRPSTISHTDTPLRLQRHVLAEEGLGVWITILQDASDIARDARRGITWGAVLKAHCQSQAEAEILV